MDDLERYQAKANKITDDSVESTRNMLKMMEDVSLQKTVKLSNDVTNITDRGNGD